MLNTSEKNIHVNCILLWSSNRGRVLKVTAFELCKDELMQFSCTKTKTERKMPFLHPKNDRGEQTKLCTFLSLSRTFFWLQLHQVVKSVFGKWGRRLDRLRQKQNTSFHQFSFSSQHTNKLDKIWNNFRSYLVVECQSRLKYQVCKMNNASKILVMRFKGTHW